jgi:nitroreductase
MAMEFNDVIRTRRSIRKFSQKAIEESVLKKILEGIRIAPSGSNRQPWKFIVIKSQETKDKLVAACRDQKFIAEAPVIIAACSLVIESNRGNYMKEFSVLVDVSIAFDHLMLAARNEGLGTCWIGAFDNETVKGILGIPKEINVVALTPLGYPADAEAFKSVENRKNMAEVVVYEKWA